MEKQLLLTDNLDPDYKLYMTFSLAESLYAAPAESIVEVIKLPMLNIPENLPEYIVGILNLRGQIINILDVRSMFGIQHKNYTTDNCILVLSHNNTTWGLIVESVNDVINLSSKQISSTPYGVKGNNTFVSNVAKTEEGLLSILNLDNIAKIIASTVKQAQIEEQESYFQIPQSHKLPQKSLDIFTSDKRSLEIFNKRARELQQELDLSIEKDKTSDQRFVTFLLNNEMYAISLQYIQEFSKILNLAIIPCVPEFYVGLSNLRGEFIPVIDIKGFLGISKTEITEKSKIIFVKIPKMQVGIMVDEVFDIINVTSDVINKPKITQIETVKFTSGEIILNNSNIINIFDLTKFLQDERLIIEEAI
ncbi:MAG: chemotaxis protein CheW [Vampirovibrionia bacterium]